MHSKYDAIIFWAMPMKWTKKEHQQHRNLCVNSGFRASESLQMEKKHA